MQVELVQLVHVFFPVKSDMGRTGRIWPDYPTVTPRERERERTYIKIYIYNIYIYLSGGSEAILHETENSEQLNLLLGFS